jgi:hypothetical protein
MVLNKLPAEVKNFEFLYKKELEVNTQLKQVMMIEKREDFTQVLMNMLRIYKQISMLSISKTDRGYLKVNFKNLSQDNRDVYVILQVLNEYKVIEICPNINIKHLEDELTTNKNFTIFLTKLASEILKHFSR